MINILNKSENATLNWLPYIYKMMKASKAIESVCEYSKTRLSITVNVLLMLSQRDTFKTFKYDKGPNLNRNFSLDLQKSTTYQI